MCREYEEEREGVGREGELVTWVEMNVKLKT